ncbi:hypothetical protein BDZ45DRAFT_662909 [Acephala macrosclerotiorum]|nr:hypothetical protein BDZ45DRAFT_662909 [Acephala macrosclerotiorum]
MDAGSSRDPDSLNSNTGAAQNKSTAKGSSSTTKRHTKDAAKPKPIPSASGTRFQCPRCPKNFSRIENLTRHQANHEDVGKFACVICRKRFTRSDLLNRHRRIHGNQTDAKHVTNEFGNASPSGVPGFDPPQDDRRSASQEASSLSNAAPNPGYQNQMQQHVHSNQVQDIYQQPLPGPGAPMVQQPQAQGLTSLMEAALAPQDAFSSTPFDNINPSLWDGFMRLGDTTNAYMGSYDADMSWTLDYLPAEGSPNYLLDQDMLNAFDDFGRDPYAYQQPLQYSQPTVNDNEDAEADDEDTSDWPDKVKSEAPERQPNRVIPFQLLPISWQPVLDEARASGFSSSTIRPFQMLNENLRQLLLSDLNGLNFKNEMSRPEISDAMFPPVGVLDFFLRLYVRYIQPRFPVLHLPTFDIYNSPPLLLVVMMFLGSSHSSTDRGRFSRLFHEHLRIALIRIQELDKTYLRCVDNILTYFLLCLAGTWSGSKHSYEFAEGGRGILVTACRRSRLLDCRHSARIEPNQRSGRSPMDAAWLAWIETEKRKRLGLSIYIFDCQYPALFNNQPYVSKAETTNCVFTCPEEYWEAPTVEAWKMLLGPTETPPSTYYLHALNCCLLRKWVKPPPPIAKTGEFGKIVLMYALHTHIFEWRQATSMLNPTGLMGTFGNSAHDMGEGLRERRRWLVDGLDSFAECYHTPGTSIATSLLHHLGYISLDVSLSDMHLVAGRSVNKNDASFAEMNLSHWANSEIADNTMMHVLRMLEVCHQCVNAGTAADSSYEIAVCLFTGGMVCWAFAKLRRNARREQYVEQVRKASMALRQMGCWRMCSMFGRILTGFEVPKQD